MFDFWEGNPYVEDGNGIRFLQSGSEGANTQQGGVAVDERGTLSSINATVNTCKTTPFNTVCNVNSVIDANDGTGVNMDITIECALDSQVAFDFRRASNCACGVKVTTKDNEEKLCGCYVCPFGFGRSPVSIVCEDDFIIGECTSLDCGFACNGTCNFGCGPQAQAGCDFCQEGQFSPTVSPTGSGPDVPSGAGDSYHHAFVAMLAAMVGTMLYGLI